jgi:hypothetical protein
LTVSDLLLGSQFSVAMPLGTCIKVAFACTVVLVGVVELEVGVDDELPLPVLLPPQAARSNETNRETMAIRTVLCFMNFFYYLSGSSCLFRFYPV